MKGMINEAWVTCAHNEEEAHSALTLCYSLKRTLTTRKFVVVTTNQLSEPGKQALGLAFDWVFYETEEQLGTDYFTRIFCLSLKSFDVCVYISPCNLAMKNIDGIFEEHNNFGVTLAETSCKSIFLVRPSLEKFAARGHGADKHCKSLITQNGSILEKYIPVKLDELTKRFKGLINSISIVSITYNQRDLYSSTQGLLEQMVSKYYLKIYEGDVLPLLKWAGNPKSSLLGLSMQPLPSKSEPIAIIGMSCRFPGANNLEEFWDVLIEKKNAIGTPPQFRWQEEKSLFRNTNAGFLKGPVDEFDAKFFGISPMEVMMMDPQHRLLHELVWEGLEDAAVNPEMLEGSNTSVFLGSWMNEYKDLLKKSGVRDWYRIYMGNSFAAAAARISFLLGTVGPSITTESGCSSSMVAVHLACKSLQRRETNLALACGVNLLLEPFDENKIATVLAPDGLCKTFDEKANGFGRAEGCAVLVLKRYSEAVQNGDKIWSLIHGTGMSQEGISKSMGTPTIQGEYLAMKSALEDAAIDPAQVSYVEAHGTGTSVGDPMEIASIARAYNSPNRKEPLLIGSVKTNIGHTEASAGIAGIMKVVLALHHKIIPPHRNLTTLNPAIDLEAVPAKIPLEPVLWRSTELNQSRFAGVSCFGIAGTDTHAIIGESGDLDYASHLANHAKMERPSHLLKISAKSDQALDILLEKYKNYLTTQSLSEIVDVAYTANIGRPNFPKRVVLTGNSIQDFVKKIEKKEYLRGEFISKQSPPAVVCFLFTGQGSQYSGMGRQLYETSPQFKIHFDFCAQLLKNGYNIDVKEAMWSGTDSEQISKTIHSQPSIFCLEYALFKLWESWGIKPSFVLGHSLGEFAAAVCAGILSVEDALSLVAERSHLIDKLQHGKMLVIKANQRQVEILMREFAGKDGKKLLDFAAINSNEQTVVAGESQVVCEFSEHCKQENIKCILLAATHAFHSKLMDPMLADYKKVAKKITRKYQNQWDRKKSPTCRFLSGMSGCLESVLDENYWVNQTREKVEFMAGCQQAVKLGCTTFIEIGPQPVLSALVLINKGGVGVSCFPSLRRTENDWETMLNSLGKLYVQGFNVEWRGFEEFYKRKLVRGLPHYPFLGTKYWPDVTTNGSSKTVCIHPTLGRGVPNASSIKLFKSIFDLDQLKYVKDHLIGNHIIFPGAGFLEMCLAVGLAVYDGTSSSFSNNMIPKPNRAFKVENLVIRTPLFMQTQNNTKPVQIQTTVQWRVMIIGANFMSTYFNGELEKPLEKAAAVG